MSAHRMRCASHENPPMNRIEFGRPKTMANCARRMHLKIHATDAHTANRVPHRPTFRALKHRQLGRIAQATGGDTLSSESALECCRFHARRLASSLRTVIDSDRRAGISMTLVCYRRASFSQRTQVMWLTCGAADRFVAVGNVA